jgi:hypothetical protein
MKAGVMGLGRAALVAIAILSLASSRLGAVPRRSQSLIPVPNLVGYWKLDETSLGTAADSSGYGNDGTHVNSPTISSMLPPMPNYACNAQSLTFVQANDQSVTLNSGTALALTGSLTLTAWIYPTLAANSTQRGIIEKWDPVTNYPNGYDIRLDAALELSCDIHNATGVTGITSSGASPHPTLGAWNHVAGTYDSNGGLLTIYINGVAHPTTASGVAPPTAGSTALMIGNAQGANQFEGNIDEARVYDRALTATEIGIVMNGQPPATLPSATAQPGSILLGWTAAASATGYNIYRSTTNTPPFGLGQLYQVGVTGTTFTDSAVTFGTTYYYQIRAVSVVESCPTTVVSASPLAVVTGPKVPGHESNNLAHRCGCSTIGESAAGVLLAGVAALSVLAILFRRR